MIKKIGGSLYLTGETAQEFMHKMLHPDEDATRRRDVFLEDIKIEHKDGVAIITAEILDDEAIKKCLTIQN